VPLGPTSAHDPAPGGGRATGEGAGETPRRERARIIRNERLGTNGRVASKHISGSLSTVKAESAKKVAGCAL